MVAAPQTEKEETVTHLDPVDDDPPIDAEWLRGFLARAAVQADVPAKPDNVDKILAKYGRRQDVR